MTVGLNKIWLGLERGLRVAIGLRILDLMCATSESRMVPEVAAFSTLSWKWVVGPAFPWDQFYPAFVRVHEALYEEVANREADTFFLGSNAILWEIYEDALEAGQVTLHQLPAEAAEGDRYLWDDFDTNLSEAGFHGLGDVRVRLSELLLRKPSLRREQLTREGVVQLLGF